MEPYKARVFEERESLLNKINLLWVFIQGEVFTTLDKAEQERLKIQHHVMTLYLNILDLRIDAFKGN